MNFSYMEEDFWRDREAIRKDPRARFARDIVVDQAMLAFLAEVHGIFPTPETRRLAIGKSFDDARVATSLLRMSATRSVARRALFHAVLGELGWLEANLREPVRSTASLPVSIARVVDNDTASFLEEVVSSVRSEYTSSERGDHKLMHSTDARRQQDGTLALVKTNWFSKIPPRTRRTGLFVGGSVGLTALCLAAAIPPSARRKWRIISSDLFSPEQILRREGLGTWESKAGSMVTFLRQDMRHLSVREGSLDYVDACNCLGYISSLNSRLNILERLWSSLRLGGFFRVTIPSTESTLTQMIVRKRGTEPDQWEIHYVSFSGKGALQLPTEAVLRQGRKITRKVRRLKVLLGRSHGGRRDLLRVPKSIRACVRRDVLYLSPFNMASGVTDDFRLRVGWDMPYEEEASLFESELDRLESG